MAIYVLVFIMFIFAAFILWIIPHLHNQQAQRFASESAAIRDMFLDLLNEHDEITKRQDKLEAELQSLKEQAAKEE